METRRNCRRAGRFYGWDRCRRPALRRCPGACAAGKTKRDARDTKESRISALFMPLLSLLSLTSLLQIFCRAGSQRSRTTTRVQGRPCVRRRAAETIRVQGRPCVRRRAAKPIRVQGRSFVRFGASPKTGGELAVRVHGAPFLPPESQKKAAKAGDAPSLDGNGGSGQGGRHGNKEHEEQSGDRPNLLGTRHGIPFQNGYGPRPPRPSPSRFLRKCRASEAPDPPKEKNLCSKTMAPAGRNADGTLGLPPGTISS
jgi:hypothetical protein